MPVPCLDLPVLQTIEALSDDSSSVPVLQEVSGRISLRRRWLASYPISMSHLQRRVRHLAQWQAQRSGDMGDSGSCPEVAICIRHLHTSKETQVTRGTECGLRFCSAAIGELTFGAFDNDSAAKPVSTWLENLPDLPAKPEQANPKQDERERAVPPILLFFRHFGSLPLVKAC
jgi:hypothetical protein